MTTITKKAFLSSFTGSRTALARAVIRQSRGWEAFQDKASDIARHGIDGGFSGWIYYSETCPFASRNLTAILELLEDLAADCGEPWIKWASDSLDLPTGAIIAATIKKTKHDDWDQVGNWLAWCAAEEIARAYTDQLED